MSASQRLVRAVAFGLVLVLAFALPLAGCGKPKPPVSEQPSGGSGGGSTSGGGTSSGGGASSGGGSASGGGTEGNTLGAWGTWNTRAFKAGQHYKYQINSCSDGKVEGGWYSLALSGAGGGQLKIEYAGKGKLGHRPELVPRRG